MRFGKQIEYAVAVPGVDAPSGQIADSHVADVNFKAKAKRPTPLIELIGCRNVHLR